MQKGIFRQLGERMMAEVQHQSANHDENERTLLAVLAHPDDESFGLGGTLAYYAEKGVRVYLICATRGEAGEVQDAYLEGYTSVADRRAAELRCAAAILGLTDVFFLDYRDSGMPGSADNFHPKALVAAPLTQVAVQIAHYIRVLKPQVVVTFDPIGGYKHPDHIAVHRATVEAFRMAGEESFEDGLPAYQARKLYFHVLPKGVLRVVVRWMPLFGQDPRHFGRNKDIDLLSLVEEGDFPIHASIDIRSVQKKKAAAAACHASQLSGGLAQRSAIGWLFRFLNSKEHYMCAYPPVEGGAKEKDLFLGV